MRQPLGALLGLWLSEKGEIRTMKFTRYDLPYNSYDSWKGLSKEGTFHVMSPSALGGLLPESLLSKTNSVLVMASASPLVSAFVANINRVDQPHNAVDQQPYIIVFDHSASSASGGFVDHGDWLNRTDQPGKELFDLIAASGITAYYPLAEMPTTSSGLLDDLKIDSQKAAFWNAFSALQKSTK